MIVLRLQTITQSSTVVSTKSCWFVRILSSKECQQLLVLSYEFEQRQVKSRLIQRLAKETASYESTIYM